MQKSKFLSLVSCFTVASLFLSSCNNDFDINDDWSDITVIYGLLDPAADTNWVRVQRAYLGTDAASASYNQPDSLYYKDGEISVFLESYTRGTDGSLGNPIDTIELEIDKTSRHLDDGIYTTDGFRLYRTTEEIKDDRTYRLVVKKTNVNNPNASATTEIVGRNYINGSTQSGFRFVIPNPNIITARVYNGTIEWYASNNARIYEVDMYFLYKEINNTTGVVEHFSQKLDFATLEGALASVESGEKVTIRNNANDLYTMLASALPPLKPNTLRFYKSISIEIWAGGEDLARYIDLNKPSQGVNNNKPVFPDVENGVGLLSSRTTVRLDDIKMETKMENSYYLSSALCNKGFAVANGLDTCHCEIVPGLGPQQVCD